MVILSSVAKTGKRSAPSWRNSTIRRPSLQNNSLSSKNVAARRSLFYAYTSGRLPVSRFDALYIRQTCRRVACRPTSELRARAFDEREHLTSAFTLRTFVAGYVLVLLSVCVHPSRRGVLTKEFCRPADILLGRAVPATAALSASYLRLCFITMPLHFVKLDPH